MQSAWFGSPNRPVGRFGDLEFAPGLNQGLDLQQAAKVRTKSASSSRAPGTQNECEGRRQSAPSFTMSCAHPSACLLVVDSRDDDVSRRAYREPRQLGLQLVPEAAGRDQIGGPACALWPRSPGKADDVQ